MITNAKFVAADYDADKYHENVSARGTPGYVMSRSDLCLFAACPSAWKAGKERKDSDATDWGSLIDGLFLTPNHFKKKFAVQPPLYQDKETGEMKWSGTSKVCKEWKLDQEARGIKPVSQEDMDEAKKAVARLNDDFAIVEYLQASWRQVYYTAEWQDPCGIVIPIKILIDLEPYAKHAEFGKTLGDFKTARDASLKKWAKVVNDMHYDMQAALNLDVFNAATGEKRNDFRHIIQENVHPYQTAKRVIAREFIIGGRARYQAALEYYANCLKDNHWPDYDWRADMHVNGWAVVEQESYMVKDQPAPRPEPEEGNEDVVP